MFSQAGEAQVAARGTKLHLVLKVSQGACKHGYNNVLLSTVFIVLRTPLVYLVPPTIPDERGFRVLAEKAEVRIS